MAKKWTSDASLAARTAASWSPGPFGAGPGSLQGYEALCSRHGPRLHDVDFDVRELGAGQVRSLPGRVVQGAQVGWKREAQDTGRLLRGPLERFEKEPWGGGGRGGQIPALPQHAIEIAGVVNAVPIDPALEDHLEGDDLYPLGLRELRADAR